MHKILFALPAANYFVGEKNEHQKRGGGIQYIMLLYLFNGGENSFELSGSPGNPALVAKARPEIKLVRRIQFCSPEKLKLIF